MQANLGVYRVLTLLHSPHYWSTAPYKLQVFSTSFSRPYHSTSVLPFVRSHENVGFVSVVHSRRKFSKISCPNCNEAQGSYKYKSIDLWDNQPPPRQHWPWTGGLAAFVTHLRVAEVVHTAVSFSMGEQQNWVPACNSQPVTNLQTRVANSFNWLILRDSKKIEHRGVPYIWG